MNAAHILTKKFFPAIIIVEPQKSVLSKKKCGEQGIL